MSRKLYIFLFISLFFIYCKKESPEEQIQFLTGYWEIEKVKLPDGTSKEFTPNLTLDYIQVDGEQGFRKKVTPLLDGSFLTNDSFEKFYLKTENDSLRLYYETPFDKWTETVLKAKDSILVIQNSDKKVYWYKRHKAYTTNK